MINGNKLKLTLATVFSGNTYLASTKAIEVKAGKKSVINLRSISKEEIEKNRCQQYEYAL